ncbi:MAG TPA: hypothetical protein VGI45_05350 [Terracidiphilus sp.]|jgi:antitoxin (DNA-binding transcriptional repressor) of toxin-antitoxin stability system
MRRGNNVNVRLSVKAVLVALLSVVLPHAVIFAAAANTGWDALTAVAHGLCHRQVVMLGESATHGDDHREAFKVGLVERLVNECRFDSVFFEPSHYEFMKLRTPNLPIQAANVSWAQMPQAYCRDTTQTLSSPTEGSRKAAQFKSQCLALMDQVVESGQPAVVTKHGKPVVQIIRAKSNSDEIFGFLAGKGRIVGDIENTIPVSD